MEHEERTDHDAGKAHDVVPLHGLTEVVSGEEEEERERNYFLDGLQFRSAEVAETDTVGGYLQAVLEERDAPAGKNHDPERQRGVLQMTVPGVGHEKV